MKFTPQIIRFACFALSIIPGVASAHPFHFGEGSIDWINGALHPLAGLDHILILLAVGVYFSQPAIATNLKWLLPFPLFILLGGGLALLPMDFFGWVNADEAKILSALILMALLTKFAGMPKELAMMSMFALAHGYLHTYDMLLDCQVWSFSLGFLLSTTMLVFCGMLVKSGGVRLALFSNWRPQPG